MNYPCALTHVARATMLFIVAGILSTASAEAPRTNRVDELARQLEEVQSELKSLKQRDNDRLQWEESILKRLPTADADDDGDNEQEPVFPHEIRNPGDEGSDSSPDHDEEDDNEIEKFLTPVATDCGNITFKPGCRIQSRYIYDDVNNDNDFFIRRFRLKMGGTAFDLADYYMELKIDSTGQFGKDYSPLAGVENAWLNFELLHETHYLQVGLYDAPFSRNALTSDSKLLFMDRTLIYEALAVQGVTDNTVGLLFHGRPLDGHLEYAFGVFDSLDYEQGPVPAVVRNTNDLMTAGRIVWNVFDPPGPSKAYGDYKESYIGEGRHLALGVNGAFLANVTDSRFPFAALPANTGTDFDLGAWGVDVFYNYGPLVFQAEYDRYEQIVEGANPDRHGDGWYAQAGYIIHDPRCYCPCDPVIELAVRHQELDNRDGLYTSVPADYLEETSVGTNFYFRDHNLKVQADYSWRDERAVAIDNDRFQIQLQFDY